MTRARSDQRKSSVTRFDRNVLLGFLGAIACTFLAMGITSQHFIASAQLYPSAIAVIGVTFSVLAIARVWSGGEPVATGEVRGFVDDPPVREAYRQAFLFFVGLGLYYLCILILGFMVASALFMLLYARCYGHAMARSLAAAVAGIGMAYVLSTVMDLYLPQGLAFAFF